MSSACSVHLDPCVKRVPGVTSVGRRIIVRMGAMVMCILDLDQFTVLGVVVALFLVVAATPRHVVSVLLRACCQFVPGGCDQNQDPDTRKNPIHGKTRYTEKPDTQKSVNKSIF